MQGFKIIFVATFAILAVGSEGSRLIRSPTEFEISLIIETLRDISAIALKHLNAGIEEAEPDIQKLLNEMAPEARDGLQKIIKDLKSLLKEEENRITVIFETLVDALNSLEPIKAPCVDKYSKDAKKLANSIEKNVARFVTNLVRKYEQTFAHIINGIKKIVTKARIMFDHEVSAIVKCLTPKNKDATKCVNSEFNDILIGVSDIGADAYFLTITSIDDLKPIANEIINKSVEVILKLVLDGKVVIHQISDCVAAL